MTTTTTTEPISDLLQLLEVDWHHETPCTVTQCSHDRPPARWRVVYHCGCVSLPCDPCKAKLDRALELAGTGAVFVARCQKCRGIVTGTVREVVLSIEPLT